jgi:PAS domain S-box-containing protein
MNEDPNPELPRLILDQMADAVIYADREGIIRAWNAAAEALFGHPARDALGRSLDLIIPERLRPPHWAGFDRAVANGATRHAGRATLTRATLRSGESIHVEMSFAVVVDEHGTAIGAVAVARRPRETPAAADR